MDDEKDRITTGGDPEQKPQENAGALAWQEMLDGARKKVDDLEITRPSYKADDLDLLARNVTWNYSALMAYKDLDTILTTTIRDDKEKGRNVDELEKELKRIQKRFQDLQKRNDTTWNDFRALTEKQKQELENQKEREKNAPIISIGARKTGKVKYPVDKPDQILWNQNKLKGERNFNISVGSVKTRSKGQKTIEIPMSLDFSKVEEIAPQVKQLTNYDKRIWIISDALYRAGNNIISFDQIYKYIGHSRKLTDQKDIDAIDAAFSALNAEIILDNQAEIDAGYKYPHAQCKGAILPNKRIFSTDARVLINGQETHGAIKILDKSDLLDFAADRGQIAEIPVDAFQTPFAKTDAEIELEDYVLTWLIRALDSNDKRNRTKKLNTLYKDLRITTAKNDKAYKQRGRFIDKVCRLLDYYKKLNISVKSRRLKGYEIKDDALTLKFEKVDE